MKFADPKSDIAFKKIFGNENKKEILISFLNSILDLPEGKKIQHIDILNPYQAPRIEGLKETTLDVKATDQRNIHYIIEMQIEKKTGFEKRVIYYTAKTYSSQIEVAEKYPMLNQVIFIGICDFNIFEGDDFLTRHLILNTATGRQELKDLEFNFIELPKFQKEKENLNNRIDQWIYFIKEAPNLEIIPKSVTEHEVLAAYEVANTHKWSKQEMELYDYWSMRSQDERGAIELAHMEGISKGIEKGISKGIEKGKYTKALDSARKMKAKGYPVSEITEMTGLSEKEISKL